MRPQNWLYTIPLRIRSLFNRRAADSDLDEELQFHLDQKTREFISKGLTEEDARYTALHEFRGLEQSKENCRDQRKVNWLQDFAQDLRFGARMLRKNPGFAATAILTLALGIGANTAIFSLINALILRTLPVRDPGQLVELLHRFPGELHSNGFSSEAFQLMRNQNHVFSGLIAVADRSFNVRSKDMQTQTVVGARVDGTFFTVLGLNPALGRFIGTEDDHLDRPSTVAVISWSFWKNNFDSDSATLGKQIIVDNEPVTIVGVTPRGFAGLNEQIAQSIWLPLTLNSTAADSNYPWFSLNLVGRLKPGVSIEQARSELAVLFQAAIEVPNANPFIRRMKFEMEPAGAGLSSRVRQQFTKPLLVLMAIASLMLLIVCTNVASLLLARGAARRREMAVRVCLGAGKLRLLRQVMTESLLLSVTGALLGIVLAYLGAAELVRIMMFGRTMPGSLGPIQIHFQPDLHVLLFTTGAALFAGLLFGLSPAIRALRTAPAPALHQFGRIGNARVRWLFGKTLVVLQVALSVVLLSGAVMFVGYLSNLEHLNLGFRRDHLLIVSLDSARAGYQDAQFSRLGQELVARFATIPGVRSATLSAMTPISGRGASRFAVVEGHQERPEDRRYVAINWVATNYFQTYGTPLLAGREFTPQDQNGPRVAIINQAMARYHFGERSPVGMHINFDRDDKRYEIVGVVGDATYNDIRVNSQHTVYLDTFQEKNASSQFTLSTFGDPETVAREVNRIAGTVFRGTPVARITTMSDQVDASIIPERLVATISGWFGALGALLAAIGIYGVLAYTVARRIHEIGIRMALGATRTTVMWMVLRDALAMVCAGLVIGAPFVFWSKHVAAHLIDDLPTNGFAPMAVGIVVVIAVALLAALVPSWRAARVDPAVALRSD